MDVIHFNMDDMRFFHQIRNKKATKQNLGRSFFNNLCKSVAKFLNLDEWESYTSHGIRRTSATWVADSGATKVEMKRHFRWKSETVADEYVDQPISILKNATLNNCNIYIEKIKK